MSKENFTLVKLFDKIKKKDFILSLDQALSLFYLLPDNQINSTLFYDWDTDHNLVSVNIKELNIEFKIK